jgi:hypothetical protein
MEDKDEEQRRRLYEAECLKYQDGAHDSIREFDKAILTLSAGLLALSLAFIKDVVPLAVAIKLAFLFWSWALFGACIMFTLVSFIASQKAFQRSQEIAYCYYIEQKHKIRDAPHWPLLVTRYLTYGAGICFVVGLGLTLAFTIINVGNASAKLGTFNVDSEGRKMGDRLEQKIVNVPLKKGVEPANVIKVPLPKPLVLPSNSNQAPPAQTPAPTQKQDK